RRAVGVHQYESAQPRQGAGDGVPGRRRRRVLTGASPHRSGAGEPGRISYRCARPDDDEVSMTDSAVPVPARPLAGVRIVEISSFVAVPLAGMTLTQLGAEVVRVDPIGGAADYRRWPITADGESIDWAGRDKGKKSLAADMRSAEGQKLVQRLIAECGVLITNVVGRQWHAYDTLSGLRPDLIQVEVSGRADGGTAVDYTVNAA